MAPTINLLKLTGLDALHFSALTAQAHRQGRDEITVDIDLNMNNAQTRERLGYLIAHDPVLLDNFLGTHSNDNVAEMIITMFNAALEAPGYPTVKDFTDPRAPLWWPHLQLQVQPHGDDQARVAVTDNADAQMVMALHLWRNDRADIRYDLLAEKLVNPYLAAALITEAFADDPDVWQDEAVMVTVNDLKTAHNRWHTDALVNSVPTNTHLLEGLQAMTDCGQTLSATVTIPTVVATA